MLPSNAFIVFALELLRVPLLGHFTHEPRALTVKLWEPKRKCPKAVPRHLQTHVVGHGPSRVVWSHMRPNPQPNAISMNFYYCMSSHMITQNHVVQSVLCYERGLECHVSWWFCVRPTTSKRWFFKIIQVTMKTWSIWCHVGIHVDFTSIVH